MNVKEIVKAYLEDNGFEGLAGIDCGCELSDLMPCCIESIDHCEPGYKVPCKDAEECPADGDCDWHITTTKPISQTKEGVKESRDILAISAEDKLFIPACRLVAPKSQVSHPFLMRHFKINHGHADKLLCLLLDAKIVGRPDSRELWPVMADDDDISDMFSEATVKPIADVETK